tara:strand:+ start:691 stop:1227 length:537 start_codon:yes stop_codon:yes gene_type:complete
MTILRILQFPDSKLREKAKLVEEVNAEIKLLVDNMFETMYAAPGVGLAATQVGIPKRVITIDVSEDKTQPLVVINPKIIEKKGIGDLQEGCLSVPGVYETVERAENIIFQAQDISGEKYEMRAEGLLALCVQHEVDHLNGKLFVDHLSNLKRQRIRKKIEKEQRLNSDNENYESVEKE